MRGLKEEESGAGYRYQGVGKRKTEENQGKDKSEEAPVAQHPSPPPTAQPLDQE